MSVKGIVRSLDPLGRIVIPKELRMLFGLKNASDDECGSKVEILANSEGIIIKPYTPFCFICGSSEGLKEFKGKKICTSCIKEISRH